MNALIESGRIADVILLILLIEAAVLVVIGMSRRKAWPLTGLLLNLAAGAALLLGLRAVLVGADWRLAGFWLGLAGLAHLGDLLQRLRSPSGAGGTNN
jgi:hypothetical protein